MRVLLLRLMVSGSPMVIRLSGVDRAAQYMPVIVAPPIIIIVPVIVIIVAVVMIIMIIVVCIIPMIVVMIIARQAIPAIRIDAATHSMTRLAMTRLAMTGLG